MPAKKTDRDDVTVKLDRRLVAISKLIAADRKVPLAQYLSELMKGPVERDYAQLVQKLGPPDQR